MDDNSPTISLLLKVGLEIPEGLSYHLDLRGYFFRHRILGKREEGYFIKLSLRLLELLQL
ncbi:hypothetical protein [Bacillus phage SPbetaL1]|nr:hypothetical protein [Bacillus phage SPbetaL1]